MVRFCGLCRPKAAPKPGAELSDNRHPQPVELDGDGSQRETRNAQALTQPPTDSADPELGATSSLAEKNDVAIEIWCGAYSELQEEEAQLVEVYETILGQQLLESVLGEITTAAMNIFAGATVTVKIAQMKRVTQKTIEKATEHAKPHEGVGQTWSGICGALPCRKWTTGYGTTTAVSICWAEPADTVQRPNDAPIKACLLALHKYMADFE
ncbi:hypothetical protein J7T55_012458 [Diaporthe amygdali]|uniref:uncharacterized protein n=1 Tax=Phomopsis amygdali TaxID=1214568 RepID=UPI0022FED75C|nr:uncharacterized protein J7T55_012458 [Diaporthe amygdali]KAJ0123985.1 hypothetical protein J7T55_012458 [Diaporthe amygdali]